MKILKVNELKEETYQRVSSILREKGHKRRSIEIKKWGSRNRKIKGEYQFLSPEGELFEASIFTYIYFDRIYSQNIPIEDVQEDGETDDFGFAPEKKNTGHTIEKELKLSRKWADRYFNEPHII